MERFETDHSACGIAVSGLGASRRLYLPAKIGQEMCFCGGGGGLEGRRGLRIRCLGYDNIIYLSLPDQGK